MLGDAKGERLNNSLADTPPREKADTISDTIGNFNGKAIVDMLPDNLRPAKAKINLDTLGDMGARTLVSTLAETLQGEKAKTRHVGRQSSRARSLNTSQQIEKCGNRETIQDGC